jgi:hypothetical protein
VLLFCVGWPNFEVGRKGREHEEMREMGGT